MIIIIYDNFALFKKSKLTYKLILIKCKKTGFDIESCFGVCIYLEWFIAFLSAKTHILVVELRKAETTSTSTNIRTTRSESFALFVSSDSFLTAFLRILFLMSNHFLCDFQSCHA